VQPIVKVEAGISTMSGAPPPPAPLAPAALPPAPGHPLAPPTGAPATFPLPPVLATLSVSAEHASAATAAVLTAQAKPTTERAVADDPMSR
jgi:hypothetical protein